MYHIMNRKWTPKAPKEVQSLVPCPCLFCGGRLVSSYVRRQHRGKFSASNHRCGSSAHNQEKLLNKELECDFNSVVQNTKDVPSLVGQQEPTFQNLSQPDGSEDSFDFEQVIITGSDLEPERLPLEADHDCSSKSQREVQQEETDESFAKQPSDGTDRDLELTSILFDPSLYERGIAQIPVFHGSPVTVLQALAELFDWFTSHPGTSKEALSNILHVQHHTLLPTGNQLPDNYRSALKMISPFLVDTVPYDACPNDCILYRGEHLSKLEKCPECGTNRFKSSRTPVRTFVYMPLGPRLQRLFGTSNLAQVIQAHLCISKGQSMYDVHDSKFWASLYAKSGIFGGDPRGIALSLCTDGVNPFAHHRVQYSMWPIMLTFLNLPRNIRTNFNNILLMGIVPPNGRGEPKSISIYLEVVVDEILDLCNKTLYDAYQKAPFKLKVDLLLFILDYPGINKVFGVSGSGAYQGCVWCEIQGTYSRDLSKMVYLQNKRFLPADSPLRTNGQTTEKREAPKLRTWKGSSQIHEAYDNSSRSDAQAIAKATGHKSSYSIMKLPNHNPLEQTVPDAMHTIKDVTENIFKLITGRKESPKLYLAERNLGRPIPNFSLTKEQLILADYRMSLICTPAHVDFAHRSLFVKMPFLKSHDWKQIASQGILKYCLRGLLGSQQRKSLFFFLDVVRDLLEEVHTESHLNVLHDQVNAALALLEQNFPITIQVITLHLMHHIVDGIKRYGPVYSTWMYAFERFNSWMCQRALNRAYPESTIMETYRIYDWCNYMKYSGRLTSFSHVKPDEELVALKEDTLSPTLMIEIDSLYQHINIDYGQLVREYEDDRKRCKRDGTFPLMKDWGPPARSLSDDERCFLCGPTSSVTLLQRISVRDKKTNRLVTYTPFDRFVTASKVSSSYSMVNNQFCRIESLFKHVFGSQRYLLCMVNVYGDMVKDNDSGLWNVKEEFVYSKLCTLNQLSVPLIVAVECDRVWFLNY